MGKARESIEAKLLPKGAAVIRHLTLPAEGKSAEWIEKEMDIMDSEMEGANWRLGKLSGAVYREFYISASNFSIKTLYHFLDGGDDLSKIINMAFQKYTISNPLHPDVFPGTPAHAQDET